MSIVLLAGRQLPHGDWEGDDFTPGAGGKFVTCMDSSLGRDLCFATNGRTNLDGRDVRKAVSPIDIDGLTIDQIDKAAAKLGFDFIAPQNWDWPQALAHLTARKGLVAQLWYEAIPRTYRYQASAAFGHGVFLSHFSPTSGIRVWDALDANQTHHGSWVPANYIRAALEQWARKCNASHLLVGYVPLQPL